MSLIRETFKGPETMMEVLSEIVLPVCAPRSTGLDFLGSDSTPLSEALEPPTLERPLLGLHGGMAMARVTLGAVSVNRQIDLKVTLLRNV